MDPDLTRVLRGDQLAWTEFFATYAPVVQRLVRTSRSLGSYRSSEDDCRSVVIAVFERLRRSDLRALRTFAEWKAAHPEKGFSDWLTIVTTNVIKDYVSRKLGTPRAGVASAKQLVNTLAAALTTGHAPAVRPDATTRETAREIRAYAEAHLPPEQVAALLAWMAGDSFAELAKQQDLASPAVAERQVRAALARLRRHFADKVPTRGASE